MAISSLNSDVSASQNPWSRYSVLSLDGSGFRVLSELLILRRLMQRVIHFERNVENPCAETSADSPLIERSQIADEYEKMKAGQYGTTRKPSEAESTKSEYLPCHYFDFIVGTSTGGLVALMLGELRMSVDAALDFYLKIMPQLYSLHYESALRKMLSVKRRNPQEKLFKIIDSLGENPMSSDESKCKTVVCSFLESDNGQVVPFLFRSYRESEFDQADRTVAEIAKAGCCHPYSFEPVKLGTYSVYDTGFIFTNPSSIIIDELDRYRPVHKDRHNGTYNHSTSSLVEKHKATKSTATQTRLSLLMRNDNENSSDETKNGRLPVEAGEDDQDESDLDYSESDQKEQRSQTPISLLISLGSGYDLTKKSEKGSSTTARLNRILRATAEPVHREVDRRSRTDTQLFSYIRLNANLKLPKLVISYSSKDESRKLGREIEERTETFLSGSEITKKVNETASKLVALRRQRCQTRAWEAFAFGWRYKCAVCRKENAAMNVDKPIETFHSAADLVDHFLRQHDSWKVGSDFNHELQMLTKESRTNSDELRKGKKDVQVFN